jgi:hypothetical protein
MFLHFNSYKFPVVTLYRLNYVQTDHHASGNERCIATIKQTKSHITDKNVAKYGSHMNYHIRDQEVQVAS